jgi:hypothetical protein
VLLCLTCQPVGLWLFGILHFYLLFRDTISHSLAHSLTHTDSQRERERERERERCASNTSNGEAEVCRVVVMDIVHAIDKFVPATYKVGYLLLAAESGDALGGGGVGAVVVSVGTNGSELGDTVEAAVGELGAVGALSLNT